MTAASAKKKKSTASKKAASKKTTTKKQSPSSASKASSSARKKQGGAARKAAAKKTAAQKSPAPAKARKETKADRENKAEGYAAGAPADRADLDVFAGHAVNKNLSKEERIHLYREMARIRRFEERSLRVYQQGKIGGFLHLYIGQEAVAVGACSLMGENDHIITAYRDHGHALACGMSMNECMAELTGKVTGCSKGKGGSMHFFAPDKRFWGGHGIVAGQTPLGAGIAFALKYQEIEGACMCFLGDGATNQGAFFESLNLAALWELPVVYIIENNGFSMGTSLTRHTSGHALAEKAKSFEMDWAVAKGNDIHEVRAAISKALDNAKKNFRPTLLELDTYRYKGHSVADPDTTYRTKKEIQDYRENKDPINIYRDWLIAKKYLDEDAAKEIDKEARDEAERAAEFADQSPFPDEASIVEDVYQEADNAGSAVNRGRLFFGDWVESRGVGRLGG